MYESTLPKFGPLLDIISANIPHQNSEVVRDLYLNIARIENDYKRTERAKYLVREASRIHKKLVEEDLAKAPKDFKYN